MVDVINKDEYQQKIVDEAKEFAEKEVRPFAGDFERAGGITRDLIEKIGSRGYLGATLPVEYGGLSLDPIYYGYLIEEISKACSSTRALITVQTSLVGEALLRYGTKNQKEKWLPKISRGLVLAAFALSEPNVGSDARKVETSYRKEGSSYILNGVKKWVTLGGIANLFLVFASSKGGNVSAFLVERGSVGMSAEPLQGLLAGRASFIAQITLSEVEVGVDSLLGEEGAGFTFVANTALDHGRYSIAWAATGLAQGAVEAMLKYSRERIQFGQKICEFQLIRGFIGDALAKTHAARALCIQAGNLRRLRTEDAIVETVIAKYFSSKIAMEVCANAVQVHGGNGCCSVYPVERYFREAKILEIVEGTSEIQLEIIARDAIRRQIQE